MRHVQEARNYEHPAQGRRDRSCGGPLGSGPMDVVTAADAQRRVDLRRMKRFATGLLMFVTVV